MISIIRNDSQQTCSINVDEQEITLTFHQMEELAKQMVVYLPLWAQPSDFNYEQELILTMKILFRLATSTEGYTANELSKMMKKNDWLSASLIHYRPIDVLADKIHSICVTLNAIQVLEWLPGRRDKSFPQQDTSDDVFRFRVLRLQK